MAPPTRYRAVVHAADLTLATARGAEEATTYLPGPRRRIFFHACHGVRFVSFCVSGKLFTAQHSCARALNRVTVAKLMDATMMLDEIAVFVQVVEAGSFTAAARKRAVPKSTLSRGVARLEDALRTPLLQRTARKVALTDAGRAFYDRVAPHVSGLRDAAMLAGEREEQPRGLLRVTAPGDVGEALLADALVRFSMRYPQLKLEVDLSVRMVNIVEEGFDVAIRASNKLKDSTLVARKIADVEVHYYATPSYLAKHGTPKNPDDLAKHECVLFRASDGYGDWVMASHEESRSIRVSGRLMGTEFSFVRSVLHADGGIGPLPSFYAASDVRDGRLVRVLAPWCWPAGSLYLVYPGARHIPRKVAVFRDFMVETFRPQGAINAR